MPFFFTRIMVPKSVYFINVTVLLFVKINNMNMNIPKSGAFSFLNAVLSFGTAIIFRMLLSHFPF